MTNATMTMHCVRILGGREISEIVTFPLALSLLNKVSK